ncbi:hypothetical protein SYNPS1DRAFT_25636 [Syncephalis pseudoplumigaleata]|uniref:Cullin family profile domain-containing protein n=1 Tax=Syncephalis pseudoplumigaleata TaxID=1712513 RepID=A0A4P9YRV4_9FUNG|nr:hypothetical protein SYNPS1DRAFT_25636 [Syncephalis pseudoplumigaleata]|eukprot:RKP22577.1 hypothetical protein SYNPS1DRAFT_25636 [Syncephalis pseudoplumigaleata]
MFKDMDVSRDLAGVFRQWARPFRDVDLGVNVLTHGIWPTYHPMDVILPPIMAEYQNAFKQFYNSQHKNRVLTWQHSLGHCRLRAYFPKGTKELQVSLLQAIVLLLFNDCAIDVSLSYRDIHKKTGIDEDNDQFKFNAKFQAELVRIKINSIQMKETIKENEETKERVFQDRQFQVDAAIVRIMKARKRMSHVNLSAEIYEQLKFHIPKRIESLIERDYLERDAEESNVYKYLA